MQINDMNLCDFCFEPIEENGVCNKCKITKEKYQVEAGLLLPGANLNGKYIIGRALGRGGFGATYLAYSWDKKKAVAIKEYFPVSIAYRAKGEENVNTLLVPLEYSVISDMSDGTFIAEKDGKWGLIDVNGKIIIPFESDSRESVKSEIQKRKENGLLQ